MPTSNDYLKVFQITHLCLHLSPRSLGFLNTRIRNFRKCKQFLELSSLDNLSEPFLCFKMNGNQIFWIDDGDR